MLDFIFGGCKPAKRVKQPARPLVSFRGFIVASLFEARALSVPDPDDGVVSREAAVTDGQGTTKTYLIPPTSTTFTFIVPARGETGSITITDVDAAGNRSPASQPFLFSIPQPDTKAPKQPSIGDVVYIGEVPDEPAPAPARNRNVARQGLRPGQSAKFVLPIS